jgi:hypothetical protein
MDSQEKELGTVDKWTDEVALAFFNHVETQVGLATNKTSAIVAATALYAAGFLAVVKDLVARAPAGNLGVVFYFLVGLAFVSLTAASTVSLWAVFPTRHPQPVNPKRKNMVFFGHVASYCRDVEKYVNEFKQATHQVLLDDLLSQACAKSYYLDRMFARLQWAIRLIVLSIWTFAFAATIAIGSKLLG